MEKTGSKSRGPQTPFAWRVDEGLRAYQRGQRLKLLTTAAEYLASDVGIAFSTLNSWRRDVIPLDYQIVRRFAEVCVRTAPELGETWVSDLFRDAQMAGYRDQALEEIFDVSVTATSESEPGAATPLHLGVPPELPDYYVVRTEKLQQLRAMVMEAQQAGAWIALLGMTGVGKSTLLAALGRDPEIEQAFADHVRWLEMQHSTTTFWLLQHLALSLDLPLPSVVATTAEAIATLRVSLAGQSLLLLVDNVVDPQVLHPLQALGPEVMVVVTSRSLPVAGALRIPEQFWLTVGEMTPQEAWELVQRLAPVPDGGWIAMREALSLLDYHPYAILITVGATQVLQLSWLEICEALQNAARVQVLTSLSPEHLGMWASLTLDWERLTSAQQHALASLGRLPYFSAYDVPVGQAAWEGSAAEVKVLWRTLTALHLVHAIPGTPERYALHWLVRDFARQKSRQWSTGQYVRFLLWPWRYPLAPRLRWWWPVLPLAAERVQWPLWSSQVPGTETETRWDSLYGWLMKSLWPGRQAGLKLRVTPQEWVTVMRLSVRFTTLTVLGFLSGLYGILRVVAAADLPLWLLALLLLNAWALCVTYVDLRRAVLLWGTDRVPQ